MCGGAKRFWSLKQCAFPIDALEPGDISQSVVKTRRVVVMLEIHFESNNVAHLDIASVSIIKVRRSTIYALLIVSKNVFYGQIL